MKFSHDQNLIDIAAKVERGERLTFDDGLNLYATDDLPALAKLADTVRRHLHGRTGEGRMRRVAQLRRRCWILGGAFGFPSRCFLMLSAGFVMCLMDSERLRDLAQR